MRYINTAHKAKADKFRKEGKAARAAKLKKKAAAEKARKPKDVNSPSLYDVAKKARERNNNVRNQVNSAFDR